MPQLALLVMVLTQAMPPGPAHSMPGAAQVQTPAAQVSPRAQA
jgi:hypothetical protein